MRSKQLVVAEDGSIAMTARQKQAWKVGGGVIAALLIAGTVSVATDDPAPEASEPAAPAAVAKPAAPISVADRIEPDAISRYGPEQKADYPKLFARLGDRVYEVEGLARKAAEVAVRTGQCDRVVYADVSETSTRSAMSFFVDCANKTRVRMTEAEIAAGFASSAETEQQRFERASAQVVQDQRLIAQAKKNVKEAMRDPGSVEFGDVAVSRKDGVAACGTVSAKNGFGGMSGHQGFIVTERVIYLAEGRDDFQSLWNRHCGAVGR